MGVGIRRDLSLLGLATVVGVFNSPQTKPPRPEYPIVRQIRVDQECRLLLAPAGPDAGAKKAKLVRDPVVCHLESVLSSQHMEESIVGDELHRSRVTIEEQEFVLQNISGDPAIFTVEQPLAEGWTIDSDPRPEEIVRLGEQQTALFRVHAEPGQIVRLHVGRRHVKPLKPKIIRATLKSGQ
jgi:hypothetical protein